MSGEIPFPEDGDLGTWIAGYRAVIFDAEGRRSRVLEIDASDDAGALTIAQDLAGTLVFELWDAPCMIGRSDPTS